MFLEKVILAKKNLRFDFCVTNFVTQCNTNRMRKCFLEKKLLRFEQKKIDIDTQI